MVQTPARLLALFTALAASCMPSLTAVDGQRITCAGDDDCPAGLACAENAGRCVAPGACILDDGSGDAAADGSPCDEVPGGVCVLGACVAPFCGDGVVDVGAGEGCDPRFDPSCRDDCTAPFCGDDVVDIGESCEGSRDCVACSLHCGGEVDGDDVLLNGDCDGDLDNGCECAPQTVGIAASEIPLRALLLPDGILISMLDTNIDRVDLRVLTLDGSARTLIPDAVAIDLVPLGTQLFGVALQDTTTTLFTVDDDLQAIAEIATFAEADTTLRGSRLAVDDDAFYLLDGDGVFRVGRAALVPELVAEGCQATRFGRLLSCGDVVACVDADQDALFALDKATGALDLLQQNERAAGLIEVVLHPACVDDVLLWHDNVAVYQRAPSGGVAVATLPQSAISLVALNPLSFAVGRGGGMVLSIGSSVASGDASFLVDLRRRSVRGVAAGILLDATEDGAFLTYDAARNRLAVLP